MAKKKPFTLDESDWPLLINVNKVPYPIVARFDVPEGSNGVDAAGKKVLRAAKAALDVLNKGE